MQREEVQLPGAICPQNEGLAPRMHWGPCRDCCSGVLSKWLAAKPQLECNSDSHFGTARYRQRFGSSVEDCYLRCKRATE